MVTVQTRTAESNATASMLQDPGKGQETYLHLAREFGRVPYLKINP